MPPLSLCDFIRANSILILGKWEAIVRRIPAAQGMDPRELRDHIEGVLRAIADAIDPACMQREDAGRPAEGTTCSGPQSDAELHGLHRVIAGFSLEDTMRELRALRQSVLACWTDAHSSATQIANEELIRLGEALEQVLTESISYYTAEKERHFRLFDAVLSSSLDLSYVFDVEGRFIYANKAMTDLYRPLNEMVGKDFHELGNPYAAELQPQLRSVVDTGKPCRGEIPCGVHAGPEVIYEFLFVPVLNSAGKVDAVAGTARDVTERKASEERHKKIANHDALTGLANRSLFYDRLELDVRRSERNHLPIALFFIDLDDFKVVNDTRGHDAGDQLLQQVARRISACVRGTDTVARLGGDEFTVILTELHNLPRVEIVAREILDQLAKPCLIGQSHVLISASIGIALFPEDANTIRDLTGHADEAMYMAKKAGRNRFSFYGKSAKGMRQRQTH